MSSSLQSNHTLQPVTLREHEAEPVSSLWKDAWIRLKRNKLSVGSGIFLLLLILVAIAAPLLTPYSPYEGDLSLVFDPPSSSYLIGTDELGRDMVTRLIYGARVSLSVGIIVQVASIIVGTLIGLASGYFGGIVDIVLMRMVDIMYAFPNFLFAVFMVSILEPSTSSIVLVLSFVGWPIVARLVRAETLSLREQEFVLAAQLVGVPDWKIMMRHILPNTLSVLIIQFTIGIAGVIMAEAGLSFLGIGIKPPSPSWGGMISKGRQFFRTYPHLALYPSAILGITVLAFNFLGDGLRDALDPRLRR